MPIAFSERPGRHERHLRRKTGNPLFGQGAGACTDTVLMEAQRRDHEELVAFMARLRELVQRAVDLSPTEESQTVLDLKTGLDRAYEEASGLADDQAGNKEAIRQLLAVIMATIRSAAGADGTAQHELDGEEEARRMHFQLLEYPLVADLLHPQSLIQPDELAPTLLTAGMDELTAALSLFDAEHLVLLCRDARQLVAGCGRLPDAFLEVPARLATMEARLAELSPREAAGEA